LDWTQAELAQRVGYSVATIRKLERDELRPSKHLAELLAHGLDVALTHHSSFVSFARSTPTSPVEPDAQPIYEQRRSNLPAQLTPFFGRTAEIVELTQHLTNPIARLITIVGPGGMGKTRLALAVAQSMFDLQIHPDSTGNQISSIKRQTYEDGVYFVALAPLRAIEHIVPAIAEAINLRFQADNRPPKQQLLDYLRHKQLLLVLDNFEHLQTGTELVLELLQECPGLRMLVTSREQLQLSSETLFVLESMALPSAATLPDVLSYSAVQLFVETARRVRPKFTVTPANEQAIVRICQLVGGMPLGIILAAAWVEVLSPTEIVTELSQGFDFLESELRDLPERQRSMRAVLTQSWQRLTEAERTVFMRLAVFRGGFTRMAAQQVAGASMRMLSSFVNKSLVQCEPNRRYTIHEFLRQFAEAELAAADQLDEAGEADTIGRTHAQYYLALAERSEPELHGSQQRLWLDRLEAEYDNLRAVLTWYKRTTNGTERELRLVSALSTFWIIRGYRNEGRAWLEGALARSRTIVNSVRANALNSAAWLQEDIVTARALYQESLTISRMEGDKRTMAFALRGLGNTTDEAAAAEQLRAESLTLYREIGDAWGVCWVLNEQAFAAAKHQAFAQADALFTESLALAREQGDQWQIGTTLLSVGQVAWLQGAYTRANVLLTESLALARAAQNQSTIAATLLMIGHVARAEGDESRAASCYDESLVLAQAIGAELLIATVRHNQAYIALHQHDTARATAYLLESLAISRAMGSEGQAAWSLATLGGVAAAQCQAQRAARLLGVAEACFKAINQWVGETERAEHESYIAVARAQLGEDAFRAAWAAGQAMTLEQAIAYALVTPASAIDGSPVASMNITDVTGLSPIQTAPLKTMGAVEENV
jgi:predicted ATPase/DNA-binding XRE family transcriptional regulator